MAKQHMCVRKAVRPGSSSRPERPLHHAVYRRPGLRQDHDRIALEQQAKKHKHETGAER